MNERLHGGPLFSVDFLKKYRLSSIAVFLACCLWALLGLAAEYSHEMLSQSANVSRRVTASGKDASFCTHQLRQRRNVKGGG